MLDTAREESFDRLARLAARTLGVPIALVNLVDRDRQWSKACYGLDLGDLPRRLSFCAHAILGETALVVPDATQDPRFRGSPLVTGEPGIRFYAGAPLLVGGHALGTLCVVDTVPRPDLTEERLGVLEDLAASVVAELELRRERDLARQVMEAMGQGLTVSDGAMRFEYVNPALARMLGTTPEALVGQTPLDITFPEDHPALAGARARTSSGGPNVFEARLRRADGGEVHALVTSTRRSPGRNDGRDAGAITVISNLSERKRMEEALTRERDFSDAIVDTMGGLVLVVDPLGRIVRWNRACELATGYSPQEARGRRAGDLCVAPEDLAATRAVGARLLAGEFPNTIENTWVARDGRRRRIAWTNTVLRDAAGKIEFIVGTGVDVTERRAAEEEAVRAREEAERSSRLKSEFLANMSHELRTPLGAVIGYAELLAERAFGDLNERQLEYLGEIGKSAEHLLSMVNDLLDLSKIEAGQMELHLEPVELGPVLEECAALVRERTRLGKVALVLEPGALRLVADRRKLKQIVLNLLVNAVKFTPAGGEVRLSARERGGVVEVAVRDTGVGIAPADLERLFREFSQVGGRPNEGTGLGLALTRRLVELHAGGVSVESAPGVGSTFTVRLPGSLRRPEAGVAALA